MNIIVDSTFNPFSYKDLMLPIYDYKLDYEKVEALYADLVALTEAWKDIANRENSPEAYEMYKSYSDLLNAIVDDFSQGMNPRNRRLLIDMKRRYSSDITPIARAYEAMKEANSLRDKAGPDAIFEEGRYSSIDRFLNGLTANNKFESRKDIISRTAALTQAAALSILEDPIIRNSMSPQFLEVIQKRGLGSLEELQAAIAGNPLAANRFALVKNQIVEQLGGLDRFDSEGKVAIEDAINTGLYSGLDNYLVDLLKNFAYQSPAEREALNIKRREMAQANGEEPVAVDKDGNKVYQNAIGDRWKVNKETGEVTELPSAPTKKGSSASGDKKRKLGYIHGVSFSTDESSEDYGPTEGSEAVVAPADLVGATPTTYDELDFTEQEYVDAFLEKNGVSRDDVGIYWVYLDEDGNVITEGNEEEKRQLATSKRLVIKDR